jgi:hypothetical protein
LRGKNTLSEALYQALELETGDTAAKMPLMVQQMIARTVWKT